MEQYSSTDGFHRAFNPYDYLPSSKVRRYLDKSNVANESRIQRGWTAELDNMQTQPRRDHERVESGPRDVYHVDAASIREHPPPYRDS